MGKGKGTRKLHPESGECGRCAMPRPCTRPFRAANGACGQPRCRRYGCFVLWINCKGYVQLRMSYFLCLDALPHEDVLAAGQYQLAEQQEWDEAKEEAGAEQVAEEDAEQAAAAGQPPLPAPLQTQQQRVPKAASTGTNGPGGAKVAPGPGSASATRQGPGPVAEATEQAPPLAPDTGGSPTEGEAVGLSINEVELQPRSGSSGSSGAAAAAGGGAAAARAALCDPDTVMSRASSATTSVDRGSNDAAAVAAAAAAPVDMTAAGDTPYMTLHGSSWLNLFNFFNPSLRLMLDHLDWMNPLQVWACQGGWLGAALCRLVWKASE